MALPQYRASVVPGLVVTGEVEIADEGGVDIVAAAEATLIGGVATALAVKATRVVAVIVVVAAVVAIEAVVSIADVQEGCRKAPFFCVICMPHRDISPPTVSEKLCEREDPMAWKCLH